jgi:alcohol dehydrogenase class IV
MGAKNVMVVTDGRLSRMKPVQTVIESLTSQGVPFKLYDKVAVEPTDERYINLLVPRVVFLFFILNYVKCTDIVL